MKNKYFAYFGAVLCTALWGTAFPLIKLGYERLSISGVNSKLLFAGERFTLAGLIVLLFGLVFYRKLPLPRKGDIAPVASLGLVQTALQYLFAYIGVGLTTASNTSMITGSVSMISILMAAAFFRSDRLTVPKTLGCIIGFAGIIVVNITDIGFGSMTVLGDAIVLLSAFCGAGGNIITKKISKNRDPLTLTAYQLIFGGVLLMLAGLLTGGKTDFCEPSGALILIWLALVSSISFLLWTALLRYHPVSRITVFSLLIPIFGTLWSGLLLGESIMRAEVIVALLLITPGIALVTREGKK